MLQIRTPPWSGSLWTMKLPLVLSLAVSLIVVAESALGRSTEDELDNLSSRLLKGKMSSGKKAKGGVYWAPHGDVGFAFEPIPEDTEYEEKEIDVYVPAPTSAPRGTNSPVHYMQPQPATYVHKRPHPKSKSGSKEMGKGGAMDKISQYPSRSKSGMGKGKGKGVAPPPPPSPSPPPVGTCLSSIAQELVDVVPEAFAVNPAKCCNFDGPTAVYITHAQRDDSTPTGFEVFWNDMFLHIAQTSNLAGVCFVMTGVDQNALVERSIEDVLIDINLLSTTLSNVPVIMTTDPTEEINLVQVIRAISEDALTPNIGVFNAGYANIIIEAIVSGFDRLPFVGLLDDTEFGATAAETTSTLLEGADAVPLCLNARPEFGFIGERCTSYYRGLTSEPIDPPTGVVCSAATTPEELLAVIIDDQINAVWTHVDCCSAAAEAVRRARQMGRTVVVGCQDEDTTDGTGILDFVTAQPIALEGYSASSWANFPVLQALNGYDGRGRQFFPSLDSLVNTAVFSELLMSDS